MMAGIGHIATAYELEAINRLKSIVVPRPTIFVVGDRIYFQEKWCKGDWGTAFDDDIYFTESTTPEAENIGWQPASTMPPQAAQYWFEIERVRVCQFEDLGISTLIDAGIAPLPLLPYSKITGRWDAAYSEHPWELKRWVVALDVKSVS